MKQSAQLQLLQNEKLAAIGQLAAGIAHEINNPVGFVYSNLGALQRYVADLLTTISAFEKYEGEMTAEWPKEVPARTDGKTTAEKILVGWVILDELCEIFAQKMEQ